MSAEPPLENASHVERRVRIVAVASAGTLLVLLLLQIGARASTEAMLQDPALLKSLRRMQVVSLHMRKVLLEGHAVCSVLGIFGAVLLYLCRGRAERIALIVGGLPVALATLSWCAWAVTHLDDEVRPYGPGALIGILGLLGVFVCPILAGWLAARGRDGVRTAWRDALVLLCLMVAVWTVVTLVRIVPIGMAY